MATVEYTRLKRNWGVVRGADNGDNNGLLGITTPVADTWRVPANQYIKTRDAYHKTSQQDFEIDNVRFWQLRFSGFGAQYNSGSFVWSNGGTQTPQAGQFYLVDFGSGAAARNEIINPIWDSYEGDIVVAQQYWPDINGDTSVKINVELRNDWGYDHIYEDWWRCRWTSGQRETLTHLGTLASANETHYDQWNLGVTPQVNLSMTGFSVGAWAPNPVATNPTTGHHAQRLSDVYAQGRGGSAGFQNLEFHPHWDRVLGWYNYHAADNEQDYCIRVRRHVRY